MTWRPSWWWPPTAALRASGGSMLLWPAAAAAAAFILCRPDHTTHACTHSRPDKLCPAPYPLSLMSLIPAWACAGARTTARPTASPSTCWTGWSSFPLSLTQIRRSAPSWISGVGRVEGGVHACTAGASWEKGPGKAPDGTCRQACWHHRMRWGGPAPHPRSTNAPAPVHPIRPQV